MSTPTYFVKRGESFVGAGWYGDNPDRFWSDTEVDAKSFPTHAAAARFVHGTGDSSWDLVVVESTYTPSTPTFTLVDRTDGDQVVVLTLVDGDGGSWTLVSTPTLDLVVRPDGTHVDAAAVGVDVQAVVDFIGEVV